MKQKGTFTKILAWIGTILVWLPVAAMLVTSGFAEIRSGRFLMDYLLPAEVFPVPLVGGMLLFWAALRVHKKWASIGWGVLAAALLLIGSQVIAVGSGLASGATEPEGAIWYLVIGMLILFDLSLVWVGITGIRLLNDLYSKGDLQSAIVG